MSGQVAPHEGNELEMIQAGTKVFAVLEYGKHDDLIKEYLENRYTKYTRMSSKHYGANTELMIFSLQGIQNRNFYERLRHSKQWYIETFGKEDYQRKMGKLFGYSDEDVEEFINNPPDCSCGKCGG